MVRNGCALVGLVALCSGCATQPRGDGPLARTTAVAPDLLAYLCADACRHGFPGADPLPYQDGAPATRAGDGVYEIRYEQRPDGRWSPRAAGRLVAHMAPDTGSGAVVRYHASAGLTGCRLARAEVVVQVARAPGGATLRVTAHGAEPTELQAHLAAIVTFCTALAGEDAPPCCAAHAPWQALSFLRRAARERAAGNLIAARDALRAAKAVQPDLPGLDYRIGELDRSLGQDELAVTRLLAASRAALDPTLRADAAAGALASSRRLRDGSGSQLRTDALADLARGDLDAASALAHQARASDPDPVADLRLRHRLQRARDDAFGALGTALLLREYTADPSVERLLAEDLEDAGYLPLARRTFARLLARDLPAAGLLQALRACSAQLAGDGWIGWVEAVSALATPQR